MNELAVPLNVHWNTQDAAKSIGMERAVAVIVCEVKYIDDEEIHAGAGRTRFWPRGLG